MPVFAENNKGNISGSRFAPYLAALLFVLALAPLAANFVSFHPDERHYTNGAIFMMQSGDAISPRTGEGELRFKKPILTYWAVLGSYRLFGVSALSSRLPFLAAGAVIIWLTYRMALLLFASRKVALTASMIMASNPLLMMAGVRANPDMLLALWLMVSASGFLGIMLSVKPSFLRYLAAYGGIGLAVATKGPFPALVFAAVSMGYLRFNPWRRVSWRQLFHLPAMFLGLAVGGVWFGAVYLLHGPEALVSFLGDHVGNRIGFQWVEMLGHFGGAVASLSLLFIPWLVPAMRARSGLRQEVWGGSGDRSSAVEGFVLAWAIAIILMSVPVSDFYSRYVLPVTPLIVLLLAEALNRKKERSPADWARKFIPLLALVLTLLLLAALAIRMALDADPLAMGLIALALLMLLSIAATGGKGFDASITALAAIILMIPLALFLLVQPIALPDQGSQITAKLDQLGLIGRGRVLFLGEAKPAAKLRIAAGPRLDLRELDQPAPEDVARSPLLVLREDKMAGIDLSGMEVVLASASWSELPLSALGKARKLDDLREILKQPDQRHFIAWRREGDGAP